MVRLHNLHLQLSKQIHANLFAQGASRLCLKLQTKVVTTNANGESQQ